MKTVIKSNGIPVKIGLLTNLMNPKASLFFKSFHFQKLIQWLWLCWHFSTTCTLVFYGCYFSYTSENEIFFEDNQKVINRLFGMILILIGIRGFPHKLYFHRTQIPMNIEQASRSKDENSHKINGML